jgi:hypothetical protein
LRIKPLYGIVATGKGNEGPRGPGQPSAKLELSLAVGSIRIKETHNGREEEESEEEVEVNDVCAGLVLGQRRQLWISRGALMVASSSGRTLVRPLSFLVNSIFA